MHKPLLYQLLIIAVTLIAIDAVFLMAIKKYFNAQITLVQGSPLVLNMIGATGCYLFLIFVLYHFIIKKGASVLEAFLLGASIYGVYEFTNYATLKEWKFLTVAMDTTWGGVLFATTTYAIRFLERRFLF
jgi:uncharacterized membrane protein